MSYRIINDNESRLEIEIKRDSTTNIILFTGLLAMACTVTMLTIIYRIIQSPYKLDEEITMIFLFLLVVGLFAWKICLWNVRGKEKVIIQGDAFIIKRTGTILSVPRKYELSMIENISSANNSHYPLWMKISGIAGGHVQFFYLGEPRYFGQSLDSEQAQQIADLIQARINRNYTLL